MPKPSSREAFKAAVFARDRSRCVLCGEPAVDAHHIMERKLWADGGYHLANGASVCEACHLRCEMTLVSTDDVRAACGIRQACLPGSLDRRRSYDKWGNEILADGTRIAGTLFEDDGCRRILGRGGVLHLFGGHVR